MARNVRIPGFGRCLVSAPGGIATDTVIEHTAAAGVTVDSVGLKDGSVTVGPGGGRINTDTIAEVTSGSGVTVDSCLVKDGRAFGTSLFRSGEMTGTGAEQTAAHGLGITPNKVFVNLTNIDGNAVVVTEGVHTSTDVKVTVTTGAKFRILILP